MILGERIEKRYLIVWVAENEVELKQLLSYFWVTQCGLPGLAPLQVSLVCALLPGNQSKKDIE